MPQSYTRNLEMIKFTSFIGDEEITHDYGNLFCEMPMKVGSRLVIGPTQGYLQLMIELTKLSKGPWFVLYVLVMPRLGKREPGRYQHGLFETIEELGAFVTDYREFLEEDGRHHFWISNVSGDTTLVYDQHNVIFAYGDLTLFRNLLLGKGFTEKEFWFPAPHGHKYRHELDGEEDRLMNSREWTYFPLGANDVWA